MKVNNDEWKFSLDVSAHTLIVIVVVIVVIRINHHTTLCFCNSLIRFWAWPYQLQKRLKTGQNCKHRATPWQTYLSWLCTRYSLYQLDLSLDSEFHWLFHSFVESILPSLFFEKPPMVCFRADNIKKAKHVWQEFTGPFINLFLGPISAKSNRFVVPVLSNIQATRLVCVKVRIGWQSSHSNV